MARETPEFPRPSCFFKGWLIMQNSPVVGVVMGSNSDWDIMKNACDILKQFEVPFEAQVV